MDWVRVVYRDIYGIKGLLSAAGHSQDGGHRSYLWPYRSLNILKSLTVNITFYQIKCSVGINEVYKLTER